MPPAVFYSLTLFVVALDQAVKAWVRHSVPLNTSIPWWPGVFQITHTQNPGMAFSLLEGKTFLLIAAAVLVGAVLIVAERRAKNRMPLLLGLALALPLGGAMGNLIDRVWQGYVTDLFDFVKIHFPVFNVADAAITVGIVLLAYRTLTDTGNQPASHNVAAGQSETTTAKG